MFIINPPILWQRASFIDILAGLNLTSNLKICLDAADSSSYSSGQSWLDRSGNGYDFFRGGTSGAEASDPTFNGVAGSLSSSEYFSFDGGDNFTYDTTNETWMNNLHKDNANWTFLTVWYKVVTPATNLRWFGTHGGDSTKIGVSGALGLASGTVPGALYGTMFNGTGDATQFWGSSIGIPESQWTFMALGINEATSSAFTYINGTYDARTQNWSSPSASNATYTLQIGAGGNNGGRVATGDRVALFAAWEGTSLTQGNLDDIFSLIRLRYGI